MRDDTLSGMLLDNENFISLSELSLASTGSREWIIELVDEGILEPIGEDETHWRFGSISIIRARSARRLQQDLELNLAGVALALELLDEIRELQTKLSILESDD